MTPCHFLHLIQHPEALHIKAFVEQNSCMIHLLVQLDVYIILILYKSQA